MAIKPSMKMQNQVVEKTPGRDIHGQKKNKFGILRVRTREKWEPGISEGSTDYQKINPELAYFLKVIARGIECGGKWDANKMCPTSGLSTLKVFGIQIALSGFLFALICSLCSIA